MNNKESGFRWTKDNERIVKERYVRDGPKKLAELLGTTPVSVVAKAKRLKVRPERETRPYEWTEEMLTAIKELYPTATRQELIDKIGLPYHAIQTKARKLGLRNVMRTVFSGRSKSLNNTSCDIRFFDTWTPDMAYVLGFLFADGSINKRQTDVVIGLAIKDKVILKFIREAMKSTRKFWYREGHTDENGHKHQKSVYLTVGSKIIVNRLMELGMMPRKTYRDDPFPNVPDDMLPHFVRGYFDGDGTYKGANSGWVVTGFIGSPQFIIGLRDSLVRVAGMPCNVVKLEGDETPYARVSWGAVEDLRKFRAFIYPDGYSFCLERKKKVIDDWISENETGL